MNIEHTVPADILQALVIGLHHTERAATAAALLSLEADRVGLKGTAHNHKKSADESVAAANLIRAAITKAMEV